MMFFRPSPLMLALAASLLPSVASSAGEHASDTLPAVTVQERRPADVPFTQPASADAMEGQAVEQGRIEHLNDVAQQTPNVFMADMTRAAPHLTIRGLGMSDDESDGISNSVHIDGVQVYSHALGQLFDLDRIDIQRGAQLTGPGSIGGAVDMRTRDPGFAFGGNAQIDVGTGNRRRASLGLDVPLAESTALRITTGVDRADGYVKNIALGRDDTGGWDSRFARLKLLHRDGSGGEWRLGLHHLKNTGGNDFFVHHTLGREHQSDNTEAGRNDTGYTLATAEYRGLLAGGQKLLARLGAHRSHWNFWMPWSAYQADSGQDIENRSWSAEAQLSGTSGAIDWLAGMHLGREKRDAPYLYDMSPYFKSQTTADITGTNAALFGEAGWRFARDWRVAGALRYERNRRSMDWSATYLDGFDAASARLSNGAWLPRLSLQWQPPAAGVERFAWAAVGRGYKRPGFNHYSSSGGEARTPYRAEYSNFIEMGHRWRDAQGRWELGATVFQNWLHDQQVVELRDGGGSTTANARRSHSRGLELTGLWRPAAAWQLRGFAGLLDAKYDDFIHPGVGVDYAGVRLVNSPRHSFGLTAAWKPDAHWELALSVTRQGEAIFSKSDALANPAHTLVDAQASYRQGAWTLGIYGKNLADATYYSAAFGDLVVAAAPRIVGVRLAVDF